MLGWRHGRGLADSDLGGGEPKGVSALDRAADPALGDHLQHPCLREDRDVAIEAAGGHAVKLGGKLGGGERTVAEESLDDSKPHRVQQEICARHTGSLASAGPADC